MSIKEQTRAFFRDLPLRAQEFLLTARRQGPTLFHHTRRLSHAERHALFTRAPGRVAVAPPSYEAPTSIGPCLEAISLLAVDTWALMGLVCREWYLRRASYYQLFQTHAKLLGIDDDELGDCVEFVFEWPCLGSVEAPIPVECPELPVRISSDWADHLSEFLSVRWTFSEGTEYVKQLGSVTLTHWTNPLISEDHEDPLVEEGESESERLVVREPPYVSGFLSDILALDVLLPYPPTDVDGDWRRSCYRPSAEGVWEELGSLLSAA